MISWGAASSFGVPVGWNDTEGFDSDAEGTTVVDDARVDDATGIADDWGVADGAGVSRYMDPVDLSTLLVSEDIIQSCSLLVITQKMELTYNFIAALAVIWHSIVFSTLLYTAINSKIVHLEIVSELSLMY